MSESTPATHRKIFLIGFNKTGTKSFHRYFLDSGLRSYHGGGSQEDLDKFLLVNIVRGLPCFHRMPEFDAYGDSPAIQYQYRHLEREFPDAAFILNIRSVNGWLLSRLNHMGGRYVDFMNLHYRQNRTWKEWVELWRTEYIAHERDVLEHFRARASRFRRFDIEQDSLSELITFLDDERLARTDRLPRLGEAPRRYFALEGNQIVKVEEPG